MKSREEAKIGSSYGQIINTIYNLDNIYRKQ